jgi:hypothetical protein
MRYFFLSLLHPLRSSVYQKILYTAFIRNGAAEAAIGGYIVLTDEI